MENVLYGIGIIHDLKTGAKQQEALLFNKNNEGKFFCVKYPKIIIEGPGDDYIVRMVDGSKEMRLFASHNENDLSLVMIGTEIGYVEKAE